MTHKATPQFWQCYEALSFDVRHLADKQFALLKSNADHPSLHLKRIGSLWSVRVTIDYRALAIEKSDSLVWFWIGSHQDYDRLIRRKL